MSSVNDLRGSTPFPTLPSAQENAGFSIEGHAKALELKYRPDIDGLRAIAVTIVVLYHLGLDLFRGGFVGVDVFFVISGYLITQIIVKEVAAGTFTIMGFYDRRIRRIFPALCTVLLLTTIAAPLFLFPVELLNYGYSLIATSLFSSNIFFMLTTNYFDPFADRSPLLHSWSLAVEEQFYIFFPLCLMFAKNVSRHTLFVAFLVVAVLSFILSVYLVTANRVVAFYFAPSRAWELLIGSLLALSIIPPIRARWLREGLALLAVALLVATTVYYQKGTAFPGWTALPPCIAAALLLHCGASGQTFVGRILSTRPFVFTGLISYSLYLWHWPLIVYFHFYNLGALSLPQIAGLFAASYLLAVLSWRFVEEPFRRRTVSVSTPKLRVATLVGIAAFVCAGLGFVTTRGLETTLAPDIAKTASYMTYDTQAVYRRGTCFLDGGADPLSKFDKTVCLKVDPKRENVLIFGDSHSAHLWYGFQRVYPNVNFLQSSISGCRAAMDVKGLGRCVEQRQWILKDLIPAIKLDGIVIASRWEAVDVPALVKTINYLAPYVPNIYVIGPMVEYEQPLPYLMALSQYRNDPSIVNAGRTLSRIDFDQRMRADLAGTPAHYISPFEALCTGRASCLYALPDGKPVVWDSSHMTDEGAVEFVGKLKNAGLTFSGTRPLSPATSVIPQ